MSELVIDTNIFLYSVEKRIHLKDVVYNSSFSFDPVMLECVEHELRSLSLKNNFASIALKEYEWLKRIKIEGKGDKCILDYCLEKNAILMTMDRDLAITAREKGVKVMKIEDGRRLVWYR
ncbi:hypothetical protein [Caldiplasma sukawensis]